MTVVKRWCEWVSFILFFFGGGNFSYEKNGFMDHGYLFLDFLYSFICDLRNIDLFRYRFCFITTFEFISVPHKLRKQFFFLSLPPERFSTNGGNNMQKNFLKVFAKMFFFPKSRVCTFS